MTIAIVIGVGFITLLIGYAIGASSTVDPIYPPCVACRHDYGHQHLISENANLRAEADYLRRQLNWAFEDKARQMRYPCHKCFQTIFAETPDKQKVVDLLIKATAPLDELKKEFGI